MQSSRGVLLRALRGSFAAVQTSTTAGADKARWRLLLLGEHGSRSLVSMHLVLFVERSWPQSQHTVADFARAGREQQVQQLGK